jgi:hypothetical protein
MTIAFFVLLGVLMLVLALLSAVADGGSNLFFALARMPSQKPTQAPKVFIALAVLFFGCAVYQIARHFHITVV